MKKKKNLFILIEQANREIDSKLLLAIKAAKNNYRVIIGHKGSIWSIFKYFNPGLVLLKSFGPNNTKIINYLKERNFKLISNDEEVVMQADIKEAVQRRFFKNNFLKIDHLITNGDNDTSEITRQFPDYPKKNIHILGNIRFDVMKNPYNQIIFEESEKIKKKYGNFILLATQFGRANPINIRSYYIDWVFTKIVRDGSDPNSITIKSNKRLILMQRDILEKTIEFVTTFEKNFPEKKLVISPHPGENHNFWQNLKKVRKLKNVFINSDNEVPSNRFVAACDFMITSNSTITLESFLLGKKIINFLPIKNYEDLEIKELKEISHLARSNEELNKIIQNNFQEFNVNAKKSNIKKSLINIEEDVEALNNYLNLFDKIDSGKFIFPYINKNLILMISLKNIYRKIKSKIFSTLKLKFSTGDSFLDMLHDLKVAKYLNNKEFFKRGNFYKKKLHFNDISIKEVLPRIFIIESRK